MQPTQAAQRTGPAKHRPTPHDGDFGPQAMHASHGHAVVDLPMGSRVVMGGIHINERQPRRRGVQQLVATGRRPAAGRVRRTIQAAPKLRLLPESRPDC